MPALDGADECRSRRQLVEERARRLVAGRRRDRDASERRSVGSAERAVATPHLDVVVAELLKHGRRLLREPPDALYRHDLAAQQREHGGCVAGARAHLEHRLGAVQLEQLRHAGHDPGLRHRLPVADPDGSVAIGPLALALRQKELPRDLFHRLQTPVRP